MPQKLPFLYGMRRDKFLNTLAEEGYSLRRLAKRIGVSRTTVCRWMRRLGAFDLSKEGIKSFIKKCNPKTTFVSPAIPFGRKRFIITSAISNVPVDKYAYMCFRKFAELNDAEFLVVPIFYKNVSLYHGHQDYWWPNEFEGRYVDDKLRLNDTLLLLGSLKIQATAAEPLRGITGHEGNCSKIVGHPRVAQETVSDVLSGHPLIMASTGTLSERLYSDTRSGYLAEHNHQTSALYVEVVNNKLFHHRWLHYDDKTSSMCDLGYRYTAQGYSFVGSSTLSVADGHFAYANAEAIAGTLNLILATEPDFIFLHDVFDCFSVSHHHTGDAFLQYRKAQLGQDNLKAELESTARQLGRFVRAAESVGSRIHIVPSNHHDHLYRWLKSGEGFKDSKNLDMFFKLGNIVCQAGFPLSKSGQVISDDQILRYALPEAVSNSLVWPDRKESFLINNVEHNWHGDYTPQGKRGGISSFVKMRRKLTLGHLHRGMIKQGVYVNGALAPKMGYIKSAEASLPVHTLMDRNGKRTLIHVINGNYNG